MDNKENIITKYYDLILYTIPQIEKFPRSQKFLIADRIENNQLDTLSELIEVYYSRADNKTGKLSKLNIRLETLRFLIRLAYDLKFINIKKYEIFSLKINEIGKMLGGWIKSKNENIR